MKVFKAKAELRKSSGKGDEFFTENRSGFKIRGRNTAEAREALEALLPDPDRILDEGEIFKEGSRNHAVRVTLNGRSYFLKRYNCRGLGYRIGNAFRRSRAVRTWLVNLAFRGMGLPVQEPFLCLEERRCRLLGRSYLLTEFFEESETLMHAWPKLEAPSRKRLLLRLAEILGTMHGGGGLHGDLKWYNVLVRRSGADAEVSLVDLDGSRLCRRVDSRKARKDLARFLRDLDQNDETSEFRTAFLDSWTKQVGSI